MKVIAEFVDRRNGKRYFPGDGDKIEPALDDGQAAALKKAGCIADGKEAKSASGKDQPTELKDMTVPQLKDYATEHKIDLGDATKKDDIIAAIELHKDAQ